MSRYFAEIDRDEVCNSLKEIRKTEENDERKQTLDDAITVIKNMNMRMIGLEEELEDCKQQIDCLKDKLTFVGNQYAALAAFIPDSF